MSAQSHTHRMRLVSEDMERDVHAMEGAPFNGETVGEAFGNLAAAVAAIADTVRLLCEKEEL